MQTCIHATHFCANLFIGRGILEQNFLAFNFFMKSKFIMYLNWIINMFKRTINCNEFNFIYI